MLKVVVTGPESSGKTVLATELARALGTVWSPEFARYYLAHLGRPYRQDDLRAIGRGQRLWEDWFAARAKAVLVCDTDWTVLQVWEQYGYGATAGFEWQKGYGPARPADLYLLCSPDFPWQPDPLREHPQEREVLFGWYERLLREQSANYAVLSGSPEVRLAQSLKAIRQA